MSRDTLQRGRFTTLLFLGAIALLGGKAFSNALPSDRHQSIPKDDLAVSMPVSFDDLLALANDGTAPQTFSYGQAAQQSLLRFHPPASTRGTLLIIHGGCWSNAYDRQHATPMARALAQVGYDVWLAEYRRVGDPGGGWPGSVTDIVLATQQVAALSGDHPWLVGHSAGGHLALLSATDPTLPIKGTLALAAITNLATYARQEGSCQSMVTEFMGGPPESHPDRYTSASVHNKVFPKPTHLILGEADAIVGPDQLTGLSDTSTQMIAESGHFDLIHPATAAFEQVLKALEYLMQTGSTSGG